MESSPAATMAPPPADSSRSTDPLLFSSFALPFGWGCRRPMGFCRDMDVDVVSEPLPTPDAVSAGVPAEPQDKEGPRSPKKGAAAEEVPEAPRRQWNLRDRTSWRDYRAEDARRPYKKLGTMKRHGFSATLTRQEIDADFIAITGRKPPRKPKKRPKGVHREIRNLCPGSSLAEVTCDRYKVNEKVGF